jgi:hypothetical protein
MAAYKVYGFAAYEVEVHNHIKQKVIFAISMAHQPHWLSWYFYTQDMADVWAQDYVDHKADRTARIGKMLDSAPSTPFSYSPQINVNAFAGRTAYFTDAVLTMEDQDPTLNCRIQILPSTVSWKAPAVLLNFKLVKDEPTRNFHMPKHGKVQYIRTVDLSKTSIIAELKKGYPSFPWGDDPLSTKL